MLAIPTGKRHHLFVAATSEEVNTIWVASDDTTGSFLADTCSVVSCLPPSIIPVQRPLSILPFRAANKTLIQVFGKSFLTFTIPGFSKPFTWEFFVADVANPILGEYFLAHHRLLVDCHNRRLVPDVTSVNHRSANSRPQARPVAQFPITGIGTLSQEPNSARFKRFIAQYSVLTEPRDPDKPVILPVEHRIIINGPPCF